MKNRNQGWEWAQCRSPEFSKQKPPFCVALAEEVGNIPPRGETPRVLTVEVPGVPHGRRGIFFSVLSPNPMQGSSRNSGVDLGVLAGLSEVGAGTGVVVSSPSLGVSREAGWPLGIGIRRRLTNMRSPVTRQGALAQARGRGRVDPLARRDEVTQGGS